MNVSRIIVGAAVCVLLSNLAWGQDAISANNHEALGYFDYSTGVFRPIGQMGDFDSESAAANIPQTGTITVNFTITIKSGVPSTSPISCSVLASVTDISTAGINIISETATVTATRTGNTAKCTVTIPYSWQVLTPATTKVSLAYNINATKGTAAATDLLLRSSNGSIASIPIPANGSTTTQVVNAVF
jgi:hypothetical protein